MENEEKINSVTQVQNLIKNNKKVLMMVFFFVAFFFVVLSYLDYYQNSKNEKIAEKFIQAGIYLSAEKKIESKKIYKEIIESKNKFYSLLALNEIIDSNLEKNNDEILRLFEIVENTKTEKEQKNLFKLKKALYLMKILKYDEGKKLLSEIISDDSIWKETASEILK